MKIPVLVLAFSLTSVASGLATGSSPEQISMEIKAHGATAVVERLWDSREYEMVLNHVRSGAPAWVALALKLAPGTDAGAAEELSMALGHALSNNPSVVLAIINPRVFPVSLPEVCRPPFTDETRRQIWAWIRKTKSAILAVTDTSLRSKKVQCLTDIQKTETYFRTHPE